MPQIGHEGRKLFHPWWQADGTGICKFAREHMQHGSRNTRAHEGKKETDDTSTESNITRILTQGLPMSTT